MIVGVVGGQGGASARWSLPPARPAAASAVCRRTLSSSFGPRQPQHPPAHALSDPSPSQPAMDVDMSLDDLAAKDKKTSQQTRPRGGGGGGRGAGGRGGATRSASSSKPVSPYVVSSCSLAGCLRPSGRMGGEL